MSSNVHFMGINYKDLNLSLTDSENSDQTGQHIHWVHRSFCWFCHPLVQILSHLIRVCNLLLPDGAAMRPGAIYLLSNLSHSL